MDPNQEQRRLMRREFFTSTASGDGKEAQDEWKRNEFMERREGRLMIES